MIKNRLGKPIEDLIDLDFPELKSTRAIAQCAIKYAQRYSVEDVRLATGRIHTDEGYELRRERVLSTPLP